MLLWWDNPGLIFLLSSSSGLGLEYASQILNRYDNSTVIASCRNPSKAEGLRELKSLYGDRLDIVCLDTTRDEDIQRAFEHVSSRYGKLDRLINCSAILHDDSMKPETSYTRVNRRNLMRSFETNAVGPILTCQAFLPLLIEGGKDSARPAIIANMSARVSSISDNRLGGWYSYRSSKTALNQLTKCLSLELARRGHNVAAILLHPGTCDTDLSKPWHRNVPDGKLFSRERGVQQLLEIIESCTLDENGQFFAWDRSIIEW